MIATTTDYTIKKVNSDLVKITGILRLPSPTEYEKPFNEIKIAMETSSSFSLDITELIFLNSAGISALARLIILARNGNTPLTILISNEIPWQTKSISGSLTKLWSELVVRPIEK